MSLSVYMKCMQHVVLCAHAWGHEHVCECMVYLHCALPDTCLCTASSSCQTKYSWPAAPAWFSPWIYTLLAYHKHTNSVTFCVQPKDCRQEKKFLCNHVVFFPSFLCGCVFSLSPLLQLWWRDEACRAIFCVLQFALPPVMIVLGDDLDNVTHPEANSSFLAWDEFIFGGVILKLSPYVDLGWKVQRLDEGFRNRQWHVDWDKWVMQMLRN